jgi:hypothetical protein
MMETEKASEMLDFSSQLATLATGEKFDHI